MPPATNGPFAEKKSLLEITFCCVYYNVSLVVVCECVSIQYCLDVSFSNDSEHDMQGNSFLEQNYSFYLTKVQIT
jgi:hypothetical protein